MAAVLRVRPMGLRALPRAGLGAGTLTLSSARPTIRPLLAPTLPSSVHSTRSFSLWPSTSTPAPAESSPVPATLVEEVTLGSAGSRSVASGSVDHPPSAPTAPLVELDPIETVTEAPIDLTNEFAAAGLPNGWATVPTMQSALEGAMQLTGLPWWGVIIGAVVSLKLLTFPVAIKGMRSTQKLQEMTPRMTKLMEEMKAVKNKGDSKAMQAKQSEVAAAMKEANPMAPLMPMFITTPLFVTLFFALDKMAHAGLWSMTHGGALWFPDLTEPDPYTVLPILSAVGQMASSELGFANQAQTGPAAQYAGTTKTAMRIGLLCSPLLTRSFPSAVLLMWATNAFLTAGQSFLLSRPSVKTFLGIAPKVAPAPPEEPKEDMAKMLKARIAREQRAATAAKLMQTRAAPSKKPRPQTAAAASTDTSTGGKASARRPPSKVAGRQ